MGPSMQGPIFFQENGKVVYEKQVKCNSTEKNIV